MSQFSNKKDHEIVDFVVFFICGGRKEEINQDMSSKKLTNRTERVRKEYLAEKE